jgi:magnesium chelatase subunit I
MPLAREARNEGVTACVAAQVVAAGEVLHTPAGAGGADVEAIVEYFEGGGALQVGEDSGAQACVLGFETVPGLLELVDQVGLAASTAGDGIRAAACELVLEALVAQRRVSRTTSGGYARARHEAPKGKGFQGFDPFAG